MELAHLVDLGRLHRRAALGAWFSAAGRGRDGDALFLAGFNGGGAGFFPGRFHDASNALLAGDARLGLRLRRLLLQVLRVVGEVRGVDLGRRLGGAALRFRVDLVHRQHGGLGLEEALAGVGADQPARHAVPRRLDRVHGRLGVIEGQPGVADAELGAVHQRRDHALAQALVADEGAAGTAQVAHEGVAAAVDENLGVQARNLHVAQLHVGPRQAAEDVINAPHETQEHGVRPKFDFEVWHGVTAFRYETRMSPPASNQFRPTV
ncbi:MAG: hypothetical protein M5U25_00755 [Planctomycetota bacterium]|nr:hypothetical protein [Planctomycetota bacterium]